MHRRCKGIHLTDELAREIYGHKLKLDGINCKTAGARIKGPSAAIARIYNVSPKAVRDIWNHITWKYATSHLWNNEKSASDYKTSVEVQI